jgi:hypothetical protein
MEAATWFAQAFHSQLVGMNNLCFFKFYASVVWNTLCLKVDFCLYGKATNLRGQYYGTCVQIISMDIFSFTSIPIDDKLKLCFC